MLFCDEELGNVLCTKCALPTVKYDYLFMNEAISDQAFCFVKGDEFCIVDAGLSECHHRRNASLV